jgi:integrase
MIRTTHVSLLEFYETVYFPARLSRCSPLTDQQMRLTVRRFSEFWRATAAVGGRGDQPTILEIDDAAIDGFKLFRRDVAAPTLNKDLRHLRALLNLACRRKARQEQLYFDFESEKLEGPVAWWPEELVKIFAACDQERGQLPIGIGGGVPNSSPGIPRSRFFAALIATVYSTGARINAVMHLPLAAFDPATGAISIGAAHQKQGQAQWLPVHAETADALRQILLPPRERLFPWPYDQRQIGWPALTGAYKRILLRAGLPRDSKHLWHCLRKTNGTYTAQAAGLDAARDQLGHSTSQVTKRYIDAAQINRRSAREFIAPPPLAKPRDRQLRLFE